MKSLNEVAVLNFATRPAEIKTLKTDVEPHDLSIGPLYAAIIQLNKVIFNEISPFIKLKSDQQQYQYPKDNTKTQPMELTGKMFEKEYKSNVLGVETNEKFAKVVLDNGKIELHPLDEAYLLGSEESLHFPEAIVSSIKVSASVLTHSFLVYATTDGKLFFFDLEELTQVLEYNHGVRFGDYSFT